MMYYKITGILALHAAQIYLIFHGVQLFGEILNPILLLVATLLLAGCYFASVYENSIPLYPAPRTRGIYFSVAIGVLSIAVLFPFFRHLIQSFPHPVDVSDIMPQLEGQYDRFTHMEMPYREMILPQSKPFPVYMPMHWLPIAVPRLLGVDARWAGVLILAIATGIYSYKLQLMRTPVILHLLALLLIMITMYIGITDGDVDLGVSLETLIAGYYLILAAGLLQRNLFLTVTGIILCLLSRYTLVFWIPLFLVLLYWNTGKRRAIYVLAIMVLSVALFYGPFMLKDPAIFTKSLKYHNDAAAYEWEHGAWTLRSGIYLASVMDRIFQGTFAQKILYTRIVQATVMLVLFLGGLLAYRKWKRKINYYDFALGMLYLFLACFYLFSALTYRYYLITTLLLSTVLSVRIIFALMNKRHLEADVAANTK